MNKKNVLKCPLAIAIGSDNQRGRSAHQQNPLKYICDLGDFIFFTNSRHSLRRIIKRVYSLLEPLGLKLGKAKTFIGSHAFGFNFLAYPIAGNRLTIARSALDRYQARLLRLYEPRPRSHRLKQYISHWIQWATSAVALNIKQLLQTIHNILHTTIRTKARAIVLKREKKGKRRLAE